MDKEEYLKKIDEVIENGKYKDNWQSLSGHKSPEWFDNGKFGIFIHWGIYSVPAFGGEWYSRNMYNKYNDAFKHHIETYGPQSRFGYKDFIPMFKGENFDADRWVDIFNASGAKYVTPVAEHHDGFAMYNTEFNRWNAVNMGPKRDVLGEIKVACEKKGLAFCASSHRAEHYFFMSLGKTFDSDVNDERYSDFYGPAFYSDDFSAKNMQNTTFDIFGAGPDEEYLKDWMVRTIELIDRYSPNMIYFDWWIQNIKFKPYLKKIAAYYYNRAYEQNKEVTIDFKHNEFPPTVATFDVERGALPGIFPYKWQTDTAIGKHSWGFTNDNEYKSSGKIIRDLIDIVSKNGNMMLNIGPKPDGTFTDEETEVLRGIGNFLKLNGEGIYGTTYWKQFGEGEHNITSGAFNDGDETFYDSSDFRFTYKAGYVYCFQMNPDGKDAKIKSFKRVDDGDILIESVSLLSTGKKLDFKRDYDSMTVFADDAFNSENPICFKIKLG